MRRGFLLHDTAQKRRKLMHFNFNTWGPLYASLATPRFKGIHRYQHRHGETCFYCWESLVHDPGAHLHCVYPENEENIKYLPEWIREPMIANKNNRDAQWCLHCVTNHNENAKKSRTTAEYWAFLVLHRRNDPNSLLSTIPVEIAHHIASFLLGPIVPTLVYKRCAFQIELQRRAQFLGILQMPIIEEEEDDEDSSSSDLVVEEEEGEPYFY